jgi:hypothetical protein
MFRTRAWPRVKTAAAPMDFKRFSCSGVGLHDCAFGNADRAAAVGARLNSKGPPEAAHKGRIPEPRTPAPLRCKRTPGTGGPKHCDSVEVLGERSIPPEEVVVPLQPHANAREPLLVPGHRTSHRANETTEMNPGRRCSSSGARTLAWREIVSWKDKVSCRGADEAGARGRQLKALL